MQRDAVIARTDGFSRQFLDPGAAPAADVTGFRKQNGTSIPLLDLVQETMQRHPPRIAQVPPQSLVGIELPLIAVVIIDADQVEVARRAAQLRRDPTAQHVPRLELRLCAGCSSVVQIGTIAGCNDMDDRIAMKDARMRVGFPDGIAARDRRAHQLPFHFSCIDIVALVAITQEIVTEAPRHVGNLIHRRINRIVLGQRREIARRCAAKTGEAFHEFLRLKMNTGRPAVMAQRPDNLQTGPARRIDA